MPRLSLETCMSPSSKPSKPAGRRHNPTDIKSHLSWKPRYQQRDYEPIFVFLTVDSMSSIRIDSQASAPRKTTAMLDKSKREKEQDEINQKYGHTRDWHTLTKIRDGEHPWEDEEEVSDPYTQRCFKANALPKSTMEPRYLQMERKATEDRMKRVMESKKKLIAEARPFSFEKRENGQPRKERAPDPELAALKASHHKKLEDRRNAAMFDKDGNPKPPPFRPSGPATKLMHEDEPVKVRGNQ